MNMFRSLLDTFCLQYRKGSPNKLILTEDGDGRFLRNDGVRQPYFAVTHDISEDWNLYIYY